MWLQKRLINYLFIFHFISNYRVVMETTNHVSDDSGT